MTEQIATKMRFKSEEVVRLRNEAGMSQKGLAEAVSRFGGGSPEATMKVMMWERGVTRPNAAALVALAAALGVKAEDLFEQVPVEDGEGGA